MRYIASVGVPVDVQPGGDLTKELAHENDSRAKKVHEAVWKRRLRTLRAAEKSFRKGAGGAGAGVAGVTSRGRERARKYKNYP